MNRTIIGQRIIHLSSVDSTNNYTAKLFKSGKISSGTVIMAEIQTNGRGQRENAWQSVPFENLTFSFPISSSNFSQIVSLNHTVALAIYDFIKKYVKEVKIKWPNDIIIRDKKVGGILIETSFEGKLLKHAIVGIGININQKDFTFPSASSLSLETKTDFSPKLIVMELIHCLNNRLNDLRSTSADEIHSNFDKRLWRKNEQSHFESKGSDFKGVITGTTSTGELIIEIENEKVLFRNGEVSYLF